ncbi:PDZ domain-containing protein [Neisseriaceae bacterium PsAf]|nr:PDZ domain-containing protein [Neisseriaceae bacterium PsAf]
MFCTHRSRAARNRTSQPCLWRCFLVKDAGLEIKQILNNGHAEKAGLNPGDLIVAINHFSFTNFETIWSNTLPGKKITLHYFRDQMLHKTRIKTDNQVAKETTLKVIDENTFEAWIKSP